MEMPELSPESVKEESEEAGSRCKHPEEHLDFAPHCLSHWVL